MYLTGATLKHVVRGVGEGIKDARKAKGWKRSELRQAIAAYLGEAQAAHGEDGAFVADESNDDFVPCLQTLATWELGTRSMTLSKFIQLCAVLEILPAEVLRQALPAVETPDGAIEVDRRKLAGCDTEDLAPLKKWQEIVVQRRSIEDPVSIQDVFVLPSDSLPFLATLLDCRQSELAHALCAVAPDRS